MHFHDSLKYLLQPFSHVFSSIDLTIELMELLAEVAYFHQNRDKFVQYVTFVINHVSQLILLQFQRLSHREIRSRRQHDDQLPALGVWIVIRLQNERPERDQ